MRLEHLYEFIVPLIFVAIWAVTWMLNRDTQPLPPRAAGRRRGDEQDRPDRQGLNEFEREFRSEPSFGASSSSARNESSVPRAYGRTGRPEPVLGSGEAIVFTEPVREKPSTGLDQSRGSQPTRGAQSRKGGRGKGVVGGKAKSRPTPPEKTRELTQEVSTSMAQLKGRTLELTPLNLPLSPLISLPLTQSGERPPGVSASGTPAFARRPETLTDVRVTLADPARLREILIWSELMQPPLALRKGSHRR